ncbi:radical SAM domain iron-sulfur cluster-binding oxidoreductase with cobalamin-binding-like domain [Syntrophotalea carbinolica DSM 2380]|uniref:Radical SAM domain iron-sulfur cluster-binding oxidoreductase with cobalamin-binding-like domain n=2 Tax=Syntrophotalea carbinolica TaxID=19 RepID=Q3A790_SYNC1|nr:radical SAM domain iron-sulfur cluster-binding oxidoreductase with cobalamin-binding-like domain [Syntrophotalea carbinolica DSM 2380]
MRIILTTLHSKFVHTSLALPLLAAYCRHPQRTLLIREYTLHEPKETVLAALLAEQPDVIAFSVYIWNRTATLELADALAVARPGLRIILGGPEVSFDGPELFARHPGIAAVVRGEGETPLRALLDAWLHEKSPENIARLSWRDGERVHSGPDGPLLAELDDIPSPFNLDLVDLSRGLVYLETSRGCPYRCAFCMSALDTRVRSYSMPRIQTDLLYLITREVPCIKLVDRTFNYDAERARDIFQFILENNRTSRFHFEIGAHLLDDATLSLLEQAPPDTFQFEIGVQSTLPKTLEAISRETSLEKLEANVLRLRRADNIHLHLDLIAGLPGQGSASFLESVDRVMELRPHHLQLEPVKLLPGAPLRRNAASLGLRFDPHPPYGVLKTPDLTFEELERLRGIGRLLDLTWNAERLQEFLELLSALYGSLSKALKALESFWRKQGLFRRLLSQRALFEEFWHFLRTYHSDPEHKPLQEALARDFARVERIAPAQAPEFLDLDLHPEEQQRVRERVRLETDRIKGQGIKLQHLACVFSQLPHRQNQRTILLFVYLTRPGAAMQVHQIEL